MKLKSSIKNANGFAHIYLCLLNTVWLRGSLLYGKFMIQEKVDTLGISDFGGFESGPLGHNNY